MAGPKTPKIGKEGKSEFIGFKAPNPESVLESSSKLYTIDTADDPTYISMLKSDIYQVQRRLDKAQRSLDQMVGSRPTSARGRDIRAIAEATSEVDAIVKSSKKSSSCKLRLTELLNVKMVQLETTVLRLADGARVFRNVTGNYGSPSMSRLPAFLEIMDQLLSLQKMALRTPMRLDSELDLEAKAGNAPLPNAIKALEKQCKAFAAMFKLQYKDLRGELSANRVAGAAEFLQHMEDKAIKPVQAELEKAKATSKQLRDETAGLHDQLKEAHERLKATSKAAPTSPQRASEKEAVLSQLESKLSSVTSELERLRSTKEQEADSTAQAVGKVKDEMLEKMSMLRRQLAEKESELAKSKEALAKSQQELDEAKRSGLEAVKNDELVRQKASADASRLATENDALKAKIKILEEKSKGLEDNLKGNGGAPVLNESLQKELDAARVELEKRSKTLAGLDMYMRDMTEKKDLEVKRHKLSISSLKRDFEKEREAWRGQDEIKKGYIQKLKDIVERSKKKVPGEEEDDTFEEILREEMRVMKAAFELKMSKLREEIAQKSIAASREMRLLKEELETERRQSSSYAAKLKAIEDAKK
mmetsp:Transcript_948/g.1809  ORF Transcript_948/g.1809 Transcript_948/m.1809 type:complete len:590 (-) Transcript_948:226-1995(-)